MRQQLGAQQASRAGGEKSGSRPRQRRGGRWCATRVGDAGCAAIRRVYVYASGRRASCGPRTPERNDFLGRRARGPGAEDAGRLELLRFRARVLSSSFSVANACMGLSRFTCLFQMWLCRHAIPHATRHACDVEIALRGQCRAKRCFAALFVSGVGTWCRIYRFFLFSVRRSRLG